MAANSNEIAFNPPVPAGGLLYVVDVGDLNLDGSDEGGFELRLFHERRDQEVRHEALAGLGPAVVFRTDRGQQCRESFGPATKLADVWGRCDQNEILLYLKSDLKEYLTLT